MTKNHFYYTATNTPNELDQFYKLVEEVYVVEHAYDIEVIDQYTQSADHFVFKNADQVIAGFRINRATRIEELPSGNCTALSLPPYKQCAEISRWTVHPNWRKKLSTISTFEDYALYAKQNDIDFFIAKVMLEMINFYERYGLSKTGEAFCDTKTFAKLVNKSQTEANLQMMLLPKEILAERYLKKQNR